MSADGGGGPARGAEVDRDAILVSARAEFVQRGFAGARIRDVSAATGTSDATIYRLFPSKQALFDEVLGDALGRLVEQIRTMAAEFPSASRSARFDLARRTQERVLHLFEDVAPLLGVALFHDSEAGRHFYRERLWPTLAECAQALGGVMSDRHRERVDPQHLILAVVGMHLAAATARAQHGVTRDVDTGDGTGTEEHSVGEAITRSLAYGLDAVLTR